MKRPNYSINNQCFSMNNFAGKLKGRIRIFIGNGQNKMDRKCENSDIIESRCNKDKVAKDASTCNLQIEGFVFWKEMVISFVMYCLKAKWDGCLFMFPRNSFPLSGAGVTHHAWDKGAVLVAVLVIIATEWMLLTNNISKATKEKSLRDGPDALYNLSSSNLSFFSLLSIRKISQLPYQKKKKISQLQPNTPENTRKRLRDKVEMNTEQSNRLILFSTINEWNFWSLVSSIVRYFQKKASPK